MGPEQSTLRIPLEAEPGVSLMPGATFDLSGAIQVLAGDGRRIGMVRTAVLTNDQVYLKLEA